MKNASNISKYKVLSKVYDRIFNKLLYKGRAKALSFLNLEEGQKVLLIGVGTDINRSFYEIANGLHINIHQDVPVMYSGNYRAIVVSRED